MTKLGHRVKALICHAFLTPGSRNVPSAPVHERRLSVVPDWSTRPLNTRAYTRRVTSAMRPAHLRTFNKEIHVFNLTLPTRFGLTLNILPSVLLRLPSLKCEGLGGPREFRESPAIQLHAPSEMLRLGRLAKGTDTRMGMLDMSVAHIGIAMALLDGHFAVGMFDLGDPDVHALARAALASDEMRFILSDSDDAVLVVPKLTAVCRHVLETCAGASAATFSAFSDAIEHVAHSFANPDTFDDLGLDAGRLKSVTLSVCMPGTSGLRASAVRATRNGPSDLH